ncbi:hypothetical protein TH63_02920 [Rufibacter radiotolerans]|uniref:Uncharacterized protein n=1 Tax=Rufibacter radiotolerans TaxID=1379910 RepID=A0A0H4VUE9_9BACT|nr:hypothetical protein [Rufibacter radiotolerans]AKQ47454.1 hypothetical protein TH63_02920 [Rufibacter radiotolerans]
MTTDTSTIILLILLSTLPALLVGGAMYLLTQKYLDRDYRKKILDIRLKNSETILPIRLQAYERIILFLERITPSNMLIRVGPSGLSAGAYQAELLQEIRAEYTHNLSQQLYMSEAAWQQVKKAKEDVVSMINQNYQNLQDKSKGTDLAKRILENVLHQEVDPTAQALQFLKRELHEIF